MSENNSEDKCISTVEKGGCNYVIDNNIYILGEFDDTISKNIIPNMVNLIETQKTKIGGQINFYINSPGGYAKELYGLLTMVDLAKASGIKITTTIIGDAYSCASMLAVVGDERRIFKYGSHLMHLGYAHAVSSTYEQLERNTKNQREFFDATVKIYVEHTTMKESTIKRYLKDDYFYLNAEECLKYGLVDEII